MDGVRSRGLDYSPGDWNPPDWFCLRMFVVLGCGESILFWDMIGSYG